MRERNALIRGTRGAASWPVARRWFAVSGHPLPNALTWCSLEWMGAKDQPPGSNTSADRSRLANAPPNDRPFSPITPATPPLSNEPTQVDEELRGFEQRGTQVVTGLREYNGSVEWELPRHIKRFHGGASRNPEGSSYDISLPTSGLSATHFLLERREHGMRLYDVHSTHGTWVMGSRVSTADLRPGSTFTAKPLTFVAMNDAMRRYRPALVEILGEGWLHTPDSLMVAAVSSGHMLITGARGCGQDQLARAIHDMSPREARAPVELDVIPEQRAAQMAAIKHGSKQATIMGATVILKLGSKPPPADETFLDLLHSSAYGLRVIVLAPSVDDARRALGEARVSLCQQVLLRPMALREEEILQLLDRMFAERGAPQLRAADLLPENQAALKGYGWPENLKELRDVADIIVAHDAYGGWRRVAEALGKPRTTIQDYVTAIGLRTTGKPNSTRHSLFQ